MLSPDVCGGVATEARVFLYLHDFQRRHTNLYQNIITDWVKYSYKIDHYIFGQIGAFFLSGVGRGHPMYFRYEGGMHDKFTREVVVAPSLGKFRSYPVCYIHQHDPRVATRTRQFRNPKSDDGTEFVLPQASLHKPQAVHHVGVYCRRLQSLELGFDDLVLLEKRDG